MNPKNNEKKQDSKEEFISYEEIHQKMTNLFEKNNETIEIPTEVKEYIKCFIDILSIHLKDYINERIKETEEKWMNEINKFKEKLEIEKDEIQQPKFNENPKQQILPLQVSIVPLVRMDELRKFNQAKTLARKVFDSEEELNLFKKKSITKSLSIELKTEFFKKIKNQPDLLFINMSDDGYIFGCYCRKPCGRPDYWVEDENHKLFSFNGKKGDHLNNRKLEIVNWKKGCQSFKSFYFKSTGDYLYANMGIVVQSIYDKPYSQIHQWLGNNYGCESDVFVGHNNLFKTVRTMVIQLV